MITVGEKAQFNSRKNCGSTKTESSSKLEAKDVLPNRNHTQATEKAEKCHFCPWWSWPSSSFEQRTKHVLHVNLVQSCSAVLRIFHTQIKNHRLTVPKTEPYAVHCKQHDNNTSSQDSRVKPTDSHVNPAVNHINHCWHLERHQAGTTLCARKVPLKEVAHQY